MSLFRDLSLFLSATLRLIVTINFTSSAVGGHGHDHGGGAHGHDHGGGHGHGGMGGGRPMGGGTPNPAAAMRVQQQLQEFQAKVGGARHCFGIMT